MKQMRFGNAMCLALFLLSGSIAIDAQESSVPTDLGFVKGYTWGWDGVNGDFAQPRASDSMKTMADLGCDWVCISFATTMAAHDEPHFGWSTDYPRMVSDADVRHAIDLARENKLKVILKPTVNCRDRVWRAWIRFHRPLTAEERDLGVRSVHDPWGETPGVREGMVRDDEKWRAWWNNYSALLQHYAKIAQEKQVDLFCLGCEMNSTEVQVENWREVIAAVRQIYHGPLTYNANHGREREIDWWDAVDVLSVSAYYPVDPPADQTVEEAVRTTTSKSEIVATLSSVKQELARLSDRTSKPILFIETGVTSVRGAARYPWSYAGAHPESPVDYQEQANYYAAMLEVFWDEPWFLGFTWWDWPARLYPESDAAHNRDFCIHGKLAEQVLRDWYAKPTGDRKKQ